MRSSGVEGVAAGKVRRAKSRCRLSQTANDGELVGADRERGTIKDEGRARDASRWEHPVFGPFVPSALRRATNNSRILRDSLFHPPDPFLLYFSFSFARFFFFFFLTEVSSEYPAFIRCFNGTPLRSLNNTDAKATLDELAL